MTATNSASVALQTSGVTPPEFVPDSLIFPGWNIVTAVLVIALSIVVSKYVVRLIGRPVARQFHRQSVAQTILRIVRLSIVLTGAAAAASLVGLQLGDIVLSVTVFSAVLGIVLAPIVGSIINGVFILADQPYEIGDMIELDDGTRGFVDEINLRYTKVFTLDNTFLVMPNSTIRERDVINYSAEDERTRLSLDILVTYESDLDAARNLIERAARDCDQVIEGGPDIRIGSARYPAKPTAYIQSYADNGVLFRLRYWSLKPYKLLRIQSEVQTRLWDLLEESDANIEFAYPHTHLVFDETSGAVRVTGDSANGAAQVAGGTAESDARHVVASPPTDAESVADTPLDEEGDGGDEKGDGEKGAADEKGDGERDDE
ncbi:mechanosensitive ion channel [Haloferax elongans ATCC BAA-1513]|uniref:Mechanosensitive ion channel n=1 Tax=Haloferax elongans ATCC BAA-1513 TaxID=1230453 RepID=M0HF58_HALEO|nr:mechanosensitive ion channel family protein [Haloferax elongans]ELZ83161.1 mechanosensitive ion channel [Haloferax elongans ATCC BAA-1513]